MESEMEGVQKQLAGAIDAGAQAGIDGQRLGCGVRKTSERRAGGAGEGWAVGDGGTWAGVGFLAKDDSVDRFRGDLLWIKVVMLWGDWHPAGPMPDHPSFSSFHDPLADLYPLPYPHVDPPAASWAEKVYRTGPSQVERLKNLALYIPPSSPAFHQQRQQSPTIIHSPIIHSPIVHSPIVHSPTVIHSPIPIPVPAHPQPPPYFQQAYAPAYDLHLYQRHLFDLSASPPRSAGPTPAAFYSQPPFPAPPADLPPSFPVDTRYSADPRYEQPVTYVDVCDPQFVSAVADPPDSAHGSEPDDAAFQHYVPEQHDDPDADGEDDLDAAFSPAPPPPPPPHPAEPREDDYEDDDEDDDLESEDDDDMRDPEFVLRRTRKSAPAPPTALPSSYPLEGRSLRSGRFNPYPSYSASPTADTAPGEFAIAHEQQPYSSPPLRARRIYPHSHASVSPTPSEPYSPVSVASAGAGATRRRARPTTSLPIPIPVPNLTKKSRGRRVPTMDDFKDELDAPAPAPAPAHAHAHGKGKKKGAPLGGAVAKSMRTYTCDVDGCGKLFARGEHLKRHIRSIHTYEKRECGSLCARVNADADDDDEQRTGHMRVHKDYVPPKDGEKA
ncbi:hypothetical protein C0993_000563 [Termitomyces sp. T159_Od127]|nr:hypothetical protein C0993_000563 [Termitomyces sp. T159_Od127]